MQQVPGHTHLYRRGPKYYLYRRVPLDLIGKAGFGVHVKVSLRTTDQVRAKELVRIKSAEFDQKFAAARRSLRLTPTNSMAPSEVERLSAEWRRSTLDWLIADPYLIASEDGEYTTLDHYADALREADDKGPKAAWQAVAAEVRRLLAAEGISLDHRSGDFRRLCDAMLRTYSEALKLVKAIRSHQPLDRKAILGPDVATSITVGQAITAYLADKAKSHRSAKTPLRADPERS